MAMLKVIPNKVERIDVNSKLIGQWKSYKEWQRLFPSFKFTLMNVDDFNECFERSAIKMITEMQLAYISEQSQELCFETIRFNVKKLTRIGLVNFVVSLAAQECYLRADEILEAWWD
jgi:hypothetical protein